MSAGCLEGVWEVSGGFLAHSGLCVGHINAKSIVLNPVGIITLVCFIFFQWPTLVFGRAARPKAKSEIAPFSLCPLRFSKIVPSSGHYCQQKNSPAFLLAQKSVKMRHSTLWSKTGTNRVPTGALSGPKSGLTECQQGPSLVQNRD